AKLDFFDLAAVDTYRGPQGTLFGRSTTGGAVVVRPQAPTFDFGGYVDTTFGNFNAFNLEGAVNIPIVKDKLAVRLAGIRIRRDGFVTDVVNGDKLYDDHADALRAQILFRPAEVFEDKVLYSYRDQHAHAGAYFPTYQSTDLSAFGFDTT